jgi:hypothetical protein
MKRIIILYVYYFRYLFRRRILSNDSFEISHFNVCSPSPREVAGYRSPNMSLRAEQLPLLHAKSLLHHLHHPRPSRRMNSISLTPPPSPPSSSFERYNNYFSSQALLPSSSPSFFEKRNFDSFPSTPLSLLLFEEEDDFLLPFLLSYLSDDFLCRTSNSNLEIINVLFVISVFEIAVNIVSFLFTIKQDGTIKAFLKFIIMVIINDLIIVYNTKGICNINSSGVWIMI